MLEREGVRFNHKRAYRLNKEAGLAVKKRPRRHGSAVPRQALALPSGPNKVWSMDFVFVTLSTGNRIKCSTIVDDYTKEDVDIVVDRSISHYAARALSKIKRFRGAPQTNRTDQGPEFTGQALDQWATKNGVELRLIQAGKPTQNAFIESFNGKIRDECLNEHWFHTMGNARVVIAAWRRECNEYRSHNSLGKLTISEFAGLCREVKWMPKGNEWLSSKMKCNTNLEVLCCDENQIQTS